MLKSAQCRYRRTTGACVCVNLLTVVPVQPQTYTVALYVQVTNRYPEYIADYFQHLINVFGPEFTLIYIYL